MILFSPRVSFFSFCSFKSPNGLEHDYLEELPIDFWQEASNLVPYYYMESSSFPKRHPTLIGAS